MNNKLISIIVPIYKVEKYIHNCIESVLAQTYTNWELILVDDGSPDSSAQICSDYVAIDQRISLIRKKNGGVASARNKGLEIYNGAYVSFLDGDDYLHRDYLKSLIELALNYSADIVQCSYVRGTELIFPSEKKKTKVEVLDNHSVFLQGYAKVILWGKLYKREIIGEVRMPEATYFEDDYTTWKWYYKANVILVTSKKLYYYMANDQSTMANHYAKPSLDFLEAYDERISFFQATNEKELEEYTRMQLCLSMVILRGNPKATYEQKNLVTNRFNENWRLIKKSRFIPWKWRVVFKIFDIFPSITSVLVFKINK